VFDEDLDAPGNDADGGEKGDDGDERRRDRPSTFSSEREIRAGEVGSRSES
jgi:hypothetical protein